MILSLASLMVATSNDCKYMCGVAKLVVLMAKNVGKN